MGRKPCCNKEEVKRGAWSSHEDKLLMQFITVHGEGRWKTLPEKAGSRRCGKNCCLRWLNYLRSDIKRGNITLEEEELIIKLHKLLGNRWVNSVQGIWQLYLEKQLSACTTQSSTFVQLGWSLIAKRLPGRRTDNEIKNYWNTYLKKKVSEIASKPMVPSKSKKLALMPETNVVRTEKVQCSIIVIHDQASMQTSDPRNVLRKCDDDDNGTCTRQGLKPDIEIDGAIHRIPLDVDEELGDNCLSGIESFDLGCISSFLDADLWDSFGLSPI